MDPEGVTVHLEWSNGIIEQLMARQTADKSRSVLLILDDNGEDIRRDRDSQKTFNMLVSNSRHLSISIVFLAQRVTQIPTFMRAQTDCFMVFGSVSTRERESLYNEVSVLDKPDFKRMFSAATTGEHGFFVASFQRGTLKYYKSCETEF